MPTISLYNNSQDPWPKPLHVDPTALVSLLSTPVADDERPKSAYPMWSPARYPEKTRRSSKAVLDLCALVADVDDGTPPEEALARLRTASSSRAIVHTSYTNTEEKPKYRLVLPLAEPIPADLYSRAWHWLADLLGCMDRATKDLARCYFVPVARPGFRAWVDEGDGTSLALDWATLPDPDCCTPLRAPPSWSPSADRPTWDPRPEDYPRETLDRALDTWMARLELSALEVEGKTEERRTAIRSAAYYLARFGWLAPTAIPDAVIERFELAAERAGRLDDNIRALLVSCVTDAANDPAPIEDLVPAADGVAPPVVVKYRNAYWVNRTNGTYEGPYDGDGMAVALRDRGDVPIYSTSGAPRSRAWLLDRYGANALAAELVYPAPDGTIPREWDATSRTFRTSRAVTPAVRPRRHAPVERWLDLLLSECSPEIRHQVLDWLATANRTDLPSAALYLEGPPGAGKGLLATALASPWRTPPVPLEVAIGDYPIPLSRCPIVHLDEGTNLDARGTARLRTLISERTHYLNEKHLPQVPLVGCVRVLVTANNADALGIREIRSLADLDAIAERVLHAVVSVAAVEYLASRGPKGTDGWATSADGGPGLIAEHLAWMSSSRVVAGGSRWLVPGIRTDYHAALLWRVPEYAAVLGGILVGLATTPAPRFVWDGGDVRVDVRTLHADWARLVLEDRARPSKQALLAILGALSRSQAEAGIWLVDGSAIRSYAAALGEPVTEYDSSRTGRPAR